MVQAVSNIGPGVSVDGSSTSGFAIITANGSVSSGNAIGFQAVSLPAQGTAKLSVNNSQVAGSSTGFFSQSANAYLILSQVHEAGAISLGYNISSSGHIYTFSNNVIEDTGSGTLTSQSLQ